MDWQARLRRLERMAPAPRGRIPAASLTNTRLERVLKANCECLGVELPHQPWTNKDRAAVDTFWNSTFGLGEDFRVAGYSPRMLQISLRHSAEQSGLVVRELLPSEIHPSEDVDLGPYRPGAGMAYRSKPATG